MGSVDLKDAKLYTYLSERKTMKWTTKAFLSLIGTAALNSYILYSKNTSVKALTRYYFMISVCEALVGNYMPQKSVKKRRTSREMLAAAAIPVPIQPPSHNVQQEVIEHKITKMPGNLVKRCVALHDKRVRTRYECRACARPLCVQCSSNFHKENE